MGSLTILTIVLLCGLLLAFLVYQNVEDEKRLEDELDIEIGKSKGFDKKFY